MDQVRELVTNLDEAQRNSADLLLIEHLVQPVDNDPSVAAIKALRVALVALGIDTPKNETFTRRKDAGVRR